MTLLVTGGRVLRHDGSFASSLAIVDGRIVEADPSLTPDQRIEARGRLVLPGIVDIHGDAFERQIEPRAGVDFPLDIALWDSDRQLVASGVTTAFHGVTISWEPGLRSLDSALAVIEAIARLRPGLGCDTRVHIRWETFALDAVDAVGALLTSEPRPILAFNDHTTADVRRVARGRMREKAASRAGLTVEAYHAHLAEAWARRDAVPAAIERLAAEARRAGAVLLAHDEASSEERLRHRALGVGISEFPKTPETAAAARSAGEHTVLGAPNVVRGGSHAGAMDATGAVAARLCTVLASDYYYPAPLAAAFKLATAAVVPFADAWRLVSAHPAEAAGLSDRGALAPGLRADFIIVDDTQPAAPRVTAAYVAGQRVYAAE